MKEHITITYSGLKGWVGIDDDMVYAADTLGELLTKMGLGELIESVTKE